MCSFESNNIKKLFNNCADKKTFENISSFLTHRSKCLEMDKQQLQKCLKIQGMKKIDGRMVRYMEMSIQEYKQIFKPSIYENNSSITGCICNRLIISNIDKIGKIGEYRTVIEGDQKIQTPNETPEFWMVTRVRTREGKGNPSENPLLNFPLKTPIPLRF